VLIDLVAAGLTYAVVALAAWPLGLHIARVLQGRRTFLHPLLHPAERSIYWLTGVHEDDEQTWARYLLGVLALGTVGMLLGYFHLRLQDHLPLNTQRLPGMAPDLSLNTAVSYAANTGWENYAGEQTLSYLSQMLMIVPNQFLSMAAGMAVAVALVRGFVRREAPTVGNVYVDVTRSILYVILPLSAVGALFLVSQGVIQNVNPYRAARTLEGAMQVIAQGPVASQEVIKDMSGAGGGFFSASSAHPFENPNGLTHQFEIFLQLIVPFALAITLGRMVGRLREGLVLAGVMWAILLVATAVAANQEQAGNRALGPVGVDQARSAQQAGGNMEGKEVRFGPILSSQFFAAATGSGDGDVDAGYDSLMPVTTLVGLAQMKLGEVTPGGPGSGLYGLVLYAIQAVFVAGLMVGRTPEYLGKKIESHEIKLVALGILIVPAIVLCLSAVSVLVPAGLAGIGNPGPHGLSEVLYAFVSTAVNNGSSMAGLGGNTVYYNVTLAIAMWAGRFGVAIPVLALAGSLAAKRYVPAGKGTLATATPLFGGFLVGVIVIVGALTFFVSLTLAPVLEQLHLAAR
jgi:K+-transporting ATPase ATPase A chain